MDPQKNSSAVSSLRWRAIWLLAIGLMAAVMVGGGMSWLILSRQESETRNLDGWELLLSLLVWGVPLLLLNLLVRFFRWDFLLRGAEILIPERQSLRVFLASFSLNFTPFYLGPTIFRVIALRTEPPVSQVRRRIVGIAVAELFYDAVGIAALGLIAGLVTRRIEEFWLLAVIVLMAFVPWIRQGLAVSYCVLVNGVARFFGEDDLSLSKDSLSGAFRWKRFLPALLMSMTAWMFPPIYLWILSRAAGLDLNIAASIQAFAEGTLTGVVTPSFGGSGVTGELIRQHAISGGYEIPALVILYYRLGTFWLAMGVGALVVFISKLGSRTTLSGQQHFNQISEVYDAQIPEAIRLQLLNRKTGYMKERLTTAGLLNASPRGLDLGCGQGHYAARLTELGCCLVGADVSVGQARGAKLNISKVVVAGAEVLPFEDHSFDFAYCINTLHHLPTREAQARAMDEIARVLKPGGIFFLHEINTRNWLFRFYMGYIFPILREIDTGVELWIRPPTWEGLGNWRPVEVGYYTFIPDFAPPWLLRVLNPIENWLERSRFKHLSAHYSAVFVMPS